MIIMQGLPASGKSTKACELALENGAVRINKDLLRTMLHFDRFTGKNEQKTQEAAKVLARHFLSQGNVIIDDTNLNPKTLQSWVDLAKDMGCKIEHVVMDTPVDECLYRDRFRENPVGQHVIASMAMQYKGYGAGVPVIVCDLDGTLCNIDHRLPYVKQEKKDWASFFEGIAKDTPNLAVKEAIEEYRRNGHHIVFVSARPEDYRDETEQWLDRVLGEDFGYLNLIMRRKGDKRQDTEVKKEIYDRYLKHLDIRKMFDDRPSVIRMWRELGLDVVDCGKGVEF